MNWGNHQPNHLTIMQFYKFHGYQLCHVIVNSAQFSEIDIEFILKSISQQFNSHLSKILDSKILLVSQIMKNQSNRTNQTNQFDHKIFLNIDFVINYEEINDLKSSRVNKNALSAQKKYFLQDYQNNKRINFQNFYEISWVQFSVIIQDLIDSPVNNQFLILSPDKYSHHHNLFLEKNYIPHSEPDPTLKTHIIGIASIDSHTFPLYHISFGDEYILCETTKSRIVESRAAIKSQSGAEITLYLPVVESSICTQSIIESGHQAIISEIIPLSEEKVQLLLKIL